MSLPSAELVEIGLAPGACTLWKEELLLDYTIEVEDREFKVHKVVMASVSDYFKVMLTGGMVESQTDRVRLEGLSSLAVRNIIEFIYTGEFGVTKASTKERLACAMYLQIPAAVKTCTVSLCDEVDKQNCFHILSLFKSYAIKDGIEPTGKFIKKNIDAIVDDFKPEKMPYDEFLSLMEFWERSEWDLFVTAKEWLQADYEGRKDHINDIMTRIRYCLLSRTQLGLIRDMDMFSGSAGPWRDLVEKALIYHNLPTHQKVLDESEQTKVRGDAVPVCLGVPPDYSGILYSLQKEKSWVRCDAANPPPLTEAKTHHEPCAQPFVVVNNFIIVSDYNDKNESKFFIFDPRTLTWSPMASMGIPREDCALVYHDKHLYALGGYDRRGEVPHVPTGIIERYDFETDSWSLLTSRVPAMLWEPRTVSLAGCIYILGEWLHHVENNEQQLYCFDPQSDKWEKRATAPDVYYEVVVLELDGEAVLTCFNRDLKLCYYKPSTNQWLPRRLPTTDDLRLGDQSRVLSMGNTMYLLNFKWETGSNQIKKYCKKFIFPPPQTRCASQSRFCPLPDIRPRFFTGRKREEIEGLFDDFPFDSAANFCVMLSLPQKTLKGE